MNTQLKNLAKIALISSASVTASAVTITLSPIVDGFTQDEIPYFDGYCNGIVTDLGVTVGLNSGIIDMRGTMEFDVHSIKYRFIKSATLTVTPMGRGRLPETSVIPIQVYGYQGNGQINTEDFNEGSFVTVFDAGLSIPLYVPIKVNVTKFVQNNRFNGFVGFSMRTNIHGAQVNFGSLEMIPAPTLTVNYQ